MDFEITDFNHRGFFMNLAVFQLFSLDKINFMGLVTLDNNLKNIYDVGYSPNSNNSLGNQKVRTYLKKSEHIKK